MINQKAKKEVSKTPRKFLEQAKKAYEVIGW